MVGNTAQVDQLELQRRSSSSSSTSDASSIADPSHTLIADVPAQKRRVGLNKRTWIVVAAVCAILVIATVLGEVLSKRSHKTTSHITPLDNYTSNSDRATAVSQAFNQAWAGYYNVAFPSDSLRPVTNGSLNDRLVQLACATSRSRLTGEQKWLGRDRHRCPVDGTDHGKR